MVKIILVLVSMILVKCQSKQNNNQIDANAILKVASANFNSHREEFLELRKLLSKSNIYFLEFIGNDKVSIVWEPTKNSIRRQETFLLNSELLVEIIKQNNLTLEKLLNIKNISTKCRVNKFECAIIPTENYDFPGMFTMKFAPNYNKYISVYYKCFAKPLSLVDSLDYKQDIGYGAGHKLDNIYYLYYKHTAPNETDSLMPFPSQ